MSTSEPIQWSALQAWEQNMLVHTRVMNGTGAIPNYTADMRIAWLIFEKFSDYEAHHRFQETFMDSFGETVSNDWDENGLTFEGLSLLTSERICLAALKAVGVEVIG